MTGNGHISVGNPQCRFQIDSAGNTKNNGPGNVRFNSGAQASFAGVIQIGYCDNAAAASAAGVLPESFRAGKRRLLCQ
ncbi:MAG: hypothetical protein KDK34_23190 [Leptospiraceae bacterium]|nr:hypothetical protein [Leptospiraceae bacterium]